MIEKTYLFGKSKLTIRFGDITASDAEVLVSSDDYFITMGGGVSRALRQHGGDIIQQDAAKHVPAAKGEVVVTSAGDLSAKYIFHGITIGSGIEDDEVLTDIHVVDRILNRCIDLMNVLDISSIAFPAIGTGVARFSMADVSLQMSDTLAYRLKESKRPLHVYIYLMDRYGKMSPMDYITFFEQFACKMYEAGHDMDEISKEKEKEIDVMESNLENMRKTRMHNLCKLLNLLESQRSTLENKLMDCIADNDDEAIEKIKHQLEENNNLRLPRIKELSRLEKGDMEDISQNHEPRTVFISSTYEDLMEERSAISKVINQCEMLPNAMEFWGANVNKPASVIAEEVRKSDIYLGIFGERYGFIDEASGLSMTELEYRVALEQQKPILVYIMKGANIKENNEDSIMKFKKLLNELQKNHTVFNFSDTPQLEKQVLADLLKITAKK